MKTVLALLFLTPLIVLANGGGYITGVKSTGAFQPIGIDQVEMLSERLEIDLHIEYADIRIEYVLHNPGKKVKVEAGFPVADWSQPALRYGPGKKELGKEEMRTELEKTVAVKLENFSASLDGESLAFQVSNEKLKLVDVSMGGYGREVTGWYKVKFSFGEGQARQGDWLEVAGG
jgi:hypothetical protein